MSQQLVIDHTSTDTRLALLENGEVLEFFVDERSSFPVGACFKGIVKRVATELNAAFIQIGAKRDGFLHLSELPACYNEEGVRTVPVLDKGQEIVVQITREAQADKGPRLSARIGLTSKYIIYMPKGNYVAVSKRISEESRSQLRRWGEEQLSEAEGMILRTEAASVPKSLISSDLEFLRTRWRTLEERANEISAPGLIYDQGSFTTSVAAELPLHSVQEIVTNKVEDIEQIKSLLTQNPSVLPHFTVLDHSPFNSLQLEQSFTAALKPYIELSRGGTIKIEETEALTVVDVNSGGMDIKGDAEKTAVTVNQAAAREVAKQLRLRNLSGLIVVDFIQMNEEKSRHKVEETLKEYVDKDRLTVKIGGWTSFGLLEITRKARRSPLHTAWSRICPTCEGSGRLINNVNEN
ncbi:Rne/Rng family ribonuclease [Salsuginibacillus kocurii]|uniref:Rne/Rng family ribonuclease n=1 Tax=Salsuginibacillus kocurii TaxID=427078 RepID=UPI00035DA1B8|nr:Rne/Rng family ribonuclease [Salsuginibacillus kocurii]